MEMARGERWRGGFGRSMEMARGEGTTREPPGAGRHGGVLSGGPFAATRPCRQEGAPGRSWSQSDARSNHLRSRAELGTVGARWAHGGRTVGARWAH
eukprot:4563187-Prymnesium_polylepis.1